jgi:hypothetical protein
MPVADFCQLRLFYCHVTPPAPCTSRQNARLRKKFDHHPGGFALHADERQPSYSKQIGPWSHVHQTLRSCRDFSMPLATDQSRPSWRRA